MKSPHNLVLLLLSLLTACAPATLLATASASFTPSLTLQPSQTRYPSRTPTPSLTPFPTLTISPTSTLQPPLTEHQWQPERVLISLEFTPGDGGGFAPSYPSFILYADGNMFKTGFLKIENEYRKQLLFKKLGRKEICQNLNTLDQIGFLDYDPSDYQFIGGYPSVQGGGSVYIRVSAWKPHNNIYHELGIYLNEEMASSLNENRIDINDQRGFPVISPALRNAYYFLSEYSAEGFEIYKPDRLAVWIRPLEQDSIDYVENNENPKEWARNAPSLASMFAKIDYGNNDASFRYLVLTGRDADVVYHFLNESFGADYYYELKNNGEKIYYVLSARPVLPYELPLDYTSQIPAPGSVKPDFKLTCYPSDGILPIPTPSIP
jgi:hypothetical protein